MITNLLRIKKEDPVYPNFSKRMLSSVIDLMIVYMILSPIWHLLSLVIYAGSSPITQLRSIIKSIHDKASGTQYIPINQHPEYLDFISRHGYWPFIQEQAIQLVLLGALMLWCWTKYSSTPGKMLLSLRIANTKDLKRPTTFQFIIRLFSCLISVLPAGIGFITTLFNKEKRAWHDLLSGTVVVKKNAIKVNEE